MLHDKSVAVVVPAKDESLQIGRVLTTMPDFVDEVIVVDDGSTDGTSAVVRELTDNLPYSVHVVRHHESQGVGAAIAAGYLLARDHRIDVTAVMAGDGQMDPDDLESVVRPIADNVADYSKGNRFAYTNGFRRIPLIRKFGNVVLSMMTKVVSGYWHVSDTQCGYTAVNLAALDQIPVEEIFASYGCPNDILVKLNIAEMRVVEVAVNPLYDVGEQSKMRIGKIVIPILSLLARQFCRRLCVKYILQGGHPLVFSYLVSFVFFLLLIPLSAHLIFQFVANGNIMTGALTITGFLAIAAIQLLMTSLSADADANRHLCVQLRPGWMAESEGREKETAPEDVQHYRPAA